MSKDVLQVGVIGVGGIARGQHLPAWQKAEGCRVTAVADLSAAALRKTAEQFGVARGFSDWRELLALDDIDIVDICTPNRSHGSIALAALERGKHVLCEKPLATTMAETETLGEAVRRSGKRLMAAQHMRFKPASIQLKGFIDRGQVGAIYHSRAQFLRRRFLPPAPTFIERELSGGGPVLDLGAHVLDLAFWFMGAPTPVSVFASAECRLAHRHDLGSAWGDWDRDRFDVEDFAVGLVRFASGATLSLETSWLGFQPEPELIKVQCFGERAGLVWPEGLVIGETERVPWSLRLDDLSRDQAYEEEIRQFAQAIRTGLPPPVPLEETFAVIRILDAFYRSARLREEVKVEAPREGSPDLR